MDINDRRVENYINRVKIGEGAYGIVYKAIEKETGENVALKKISLKHETEGIPSTALREISLLKSLEHPNIVNLKDVIYYHRKIFLVFEYLDMDLQHLMKKNPNGLLPSEVKNYTKQLFSALAFCHVRQILHRDLKPQNLLLNNDGHIKLADFGLARCFSIPLRPFTHEIITLWYRAPEILLGTKVYDTSVDIWSLGCIFVEMITGRVLFPGNCEIDQLYSIFRVLGTPNEECWPGVNKLKDYKNTFPQWYCQDLSLYLKALEPGEIDLILKMLTYYPKNRISAQAALKHSYFTE